MKRLALSLLIVVSATWAMAQQYTFNVETIIPEANHDITSRDNVWFYSLDGKTRFKFGVMITTGMSKLYLDYHTTDPRVEKLIQQHLNAVVWPKIVIQTTDNTKGLPLYPQLNGPHHMYIEMGLQRIDNEENMKLSQHYFRTLELATLATQDITSINFGSTRVAIKGSTAAYFKEMFEVGISLLKNKDYYEGYYTRITPRDETEELADIYLSTLWDEPFSLDRINCPLGMFSTFNIPMSDACKLGETRGWALDEDVEARLAQSTDSVGYHAVTTQWTDLYEGFLVMASVHYSLDNLKQIDHYKICFEVPYYSDQPGRPLYDRIVERLEADGWTNRQASTTGDSNNTWEVGYWNSKLRLNEFYTELHIMFDGNLVQLVVYRDM